MSVDKPDVFVLDNYIQMVIGLIEATSEISNAVSPSLEGS